MTDLIEKIFSFYSKDEREIFVYKWERKEQELKGVVQISHGMAETARRYKDFARELTRNGYIVYANDHRGHGKSADDIENQGYLGEGNAFPLLIDDMAQLSNQIKNKHPDLPLYLFSHSMGSFASQRYIMDYPNQLDGLILSGSNGKQGIILSLGKILSKIEVLFRGKKAKSRIMNKITFGHYNRQFEEESTGVEWLTRDREKQIDYLKNPYCGSIFPASFYATFLDSLQYVEDENNFHKIPKDLPIYILSGDQDPVGDFSKGVKKLRNRYQKQGVKDLEMKIYEGARHELLNEINREEVIADIIQWFEAR